MSNKKTIILTVLGVIVGGVIIFKTITPSWAALSNNDPSIPRFRMAVLKNLAEFTIVNCDGLFNKTICDSLNKGSAGIEDDFFILEIGNFNADQQTSECLVVDQKLLESVVPIASFSEVRVTIQNPRPWGLVKNLWIAFPNSKKIVDQGIQIKVKEKDKPLKTFYVCGTFNPTPNMRYSKTARLEVLVRDTPR